MKELLFTSGLTITVIAVIKYHKVYFSELKKEIRIIKKEIK